MYRMIKPLRQMKVLVALLGAITIGGCASSPKPVDPSERDTSGQFDGRWIGEVSGPVAKQVYLPNNIVMYCNWDPFSIYLYVVDGSIQLRGVEPKTPVSKDGRFRIDVVRGSSRMLGGVASGNAKNTSIFSGNLSGEEPTGKLVRLFESRVEACRGNISLRRQ